MPADNDFAACWSDLERNGFEHLVDDQLLERLDQERKKFTESDEALIQLMTVALQQRGVYPQETRPGNPNSVLAMVNGYGAYWHQWRGTIECPHCHADQRDHKAGPPFCLSIAQANRGTNKGWATYCHRCSKDIHRP